MTKDYFIELVSNEGHIVMSTMSYGTGPVDSFETALEKEYIMVPPGFEGAAHIRVYHGQVILKIPLQHFM